LSGNFIFAIKSNQSFNMKTIGALLALILTISASLAQTNPPAMSSIDLDAAIGMYANSKGRTVLQHPRLPRAKISLPGHAQTKEEQAEALETMFRAQKIATIPDGEHFVMVVPFALTNSVTPKAPARANTNAPIPVLSVKFNNAPLEIVLQMYADYVGKKIVNPQDAPRNAGITFIQTTPLTKQEICYALETLLAWNNIRLVPEGEGNLKLEYISK